MRATHQNVDIISKPLGQSAHRIDNITNMFCENLRRWWDRQPLINLLVDKRLGFPIRDGKTPLWTGPTSAASGPQRAP